MASLRRLTPAGRRLLTAMLALALFTRALVPAGWMPSATGGLMLCDGMAPAAVQPMRHGHGKHLPAPQTPASGDHSCAFASPAAAIGTPPLAAPPAPAAVAYLPFRPFRSARIGQGLAAPPPPPTGPPAFA